MLQWSSKEKTKNKQKKHSNCAFCDKRMKSDTLTAEASPKQSGCQVTELAVWCPFSVIT